MSNLNATFRKGKAKMGEMKTIKTPNLTFSSSDHLTLAFETEFTL